MAEAKLWSVGIVVACDYRGSGQYGWRAWCHFESQDDIFHGDQRVRGRLETYCAFLTLDAAVDRILEVAQQMGVDFYVSKIMMRPSVFYAGDGESGDYPPPPGWRVQVNAQAVRLGWHPLYDVEVDNV